MTEILNNDDDVVIELIFNLLEGARYVRLPSASSDQPVFIAAAPDTDPFSQPDIKGLQIQLTGFLDKDTAPFCKELWNLLLSAQANPAGVPKELIEAKKNELKQEKVNSLFIHSRCKVRNFREHEDYEFAIS